MAKILEEFGENPLIIFQNWYGEAERLEPSDANAMAVASVDADGKPSVRMVLLKGHDERGFIFYTNYDSRKGLALQKHPHAEVNFYWKSTDKQIRIAGPVVKTDEKESDVYFATRPREAQIGAWASSQTRPMNDYEDFKKEYDAVAKKYEGRDIPRPPYWGGFRVKPERMEFWIAHPHRLHKRFVFEKKGNTWKATWLFP